MNRFILTTFALITGFFALIISLVLAIPLTVAAFIARKKIERQLRASPYSFGNAHTIEGEFEEVKRPK